MPAIAQAKMPEQQNADGQAAAAAPQPVSAAPRDLSSDFAAAKGGEDEQAMKSKSSLAAAPRTESNGVIRFLAYHPPAMASTLSSSLLHAAATATDGVVAASSAGPGSPEPRPSWEMRLAALRERRASASASRSVDNTPQAKTAAAAVESSSSTSSVSASALPTAPTALTVVENAVVMGEKPMDVDGEGDEDDYEIARSSGEVDRSRLFLSLQGRFSSSPFSSVLSNATSDDEIAWTSRSTHHAMALVTPTASATYGKEEAPRNMTGREGNSNLPPPVPLAPREAAPTLVSNPPSSVTSSVSAAPAPASARQTPPLPYQPNTAATAERPAVGSTRAALRRLSSNISAASTATYGEAPIADRSFGIFSWRDSPPSRPFRAAPMQSNTDSSDEDTTSNEVEVLYTEEAEEAVRMEWLAQPPTPSDQESASRSETRIFGGGTEAAPVVVAEGAEAHFLRTVAALQQMATAAAAVKPSLPAALVAPEVPQDDAVRSRTEAPPTPDMLPSATPADAATVDVAAGAVPPEGKTILTKRPHTQGKAITRRPGARPKPRPPAPQPTATEPFKALPAPATANVSAPPPPSARVEAVEEVQQPRFEKVPSSTDATTAAVEAPKATAKDVLKPAPPVVPSKTVTAAPSVEVSTDDDVTTTESSTDERAAPLRKLYPSKKVAAPLSTTALATAAPPAPAAAAVRSAGAANAVASAAPKQDRHGSAVTTAKPTPTTAGAAAAPFVPPPPLPQPPAATQHSPLSAPSPTASAASDTRTAAPTSQQQPSGTTVSGKAPQSASVPSPSSFTKKMMASQKAAQRPPAGTHSASHATRTPSTTAAAAVAEAERKKNGIAAQNGQPPPSLPAGKPNSGATTITAPNKSTAPEKKASSVRLAPATQHVRESNASPTTIVAKPVASAVQQPAHGNEAPPPPLPHFTQPHATAQRRPPQEAAPAAPQPARYNTNHNSGSSAQPQYRDPGATSAPPTAPRLTRKPAATTTTTTRPLLSQLVTKAMSDAAMERSTATSLTSASTTTDATPSMRYFRTAVAAPSEVYPAASTSFHASDVNSPAPTGQRPHAPSPGSSPEAKIVPPRSPPHSASQRQQPSFEMNYSDWHASLVAGVRVRRDDPHTGRPRCSSRERSHSGRLAPAWSTTSPGAWDGPMRSPSAERDASLTMAESTPSASLSYSAFRCAVQSTGERATSPAAAPRSVPARPLLSTAVYPAFHATKVGSKYTLTDAKAPVLSAVVDDTQRIREELELQSHLNKLKMESLRRRAERYN